MDTQTMNVQHSHQRMAAIAHGGIRDHAGLVDIEPIRDFDMDRTIFHTMEGRIPRFVIKTRVAKAAHWSSDGRDDIEQAYQQARHAMPPKPVPKVLQDFLLAECDYELEHADGSFLDHLHFCHEYTHLHYPERDPVVMFLHSILGTATNTFAMSTDKMPALSELVDENVWGHVQVFPSILRLLYDVRLRRELWQQLERLPALQFIRFHRVIDNEPMELDAEAFWIQVNYQLIHLVDFLPVANWMAHKNDAAFIIFQDLYKLLSACGRLEAQVGFDRASSAERVLGEKRSLGARAVDLIPVSLSEKLTAKMVRRFSAQIGHSLDYELVWNAA